jgi:hypothetical protein
MDQLFRETSGALETLFRGTCMVDSGSGFFKGQSTVAQPLRKRAVKKDKDMFFIRMRG